MLDNKKRNRLIAGVLAAVMLAGTTGCGNDDEQEEWNNDNVHQEQQSHGSIWPWFFLGRLSNWGWGTPAAAPNNTGNHTTNGSSIQKNDTSSVRQSKVGSVGSSGKTGIGSGKSRSSGSAVS